MSHYLVAGENGETWRVCVDENSENEMGRLQGVERIRRVSHIYPGVLHSTVGSGILTACAGRWSSLGGKCHGRFTRGDSGFSDAGVGTRGSRIWWTSRRIQSLF